jgi:hypothetical protein
MSTTLRIGALVLAALTAGCSGGSATGGRGSADARVSLDGSTYRVRDVSLTLETGEDPWFRIEGEPATDSGHDCADGMTGGMGLYGDLPASVKDPADLIGKRLRVDFTGDGDDANFCFAGMGGLAGAEDAWVRIDSVDGDRVTFSMTGTFKIYDENGDGPVKSASAAGAAILHLES